MRGTNNKQAFDTFADGTHCVPIISDERFNKAVGLFKEASSLDPQYGRPKGWLAYTYVLHLQEGWTFDPAQHPDEADWSKDPAPATRSDSYCGSRARAAWPTRPTLGYASLRTALRAACAGRERASKAEGRAARRSRAKCAQAGCAGRYRASTG